MKASWDERACTALSFPAKLICIGISRDGLFTEYTGPVIIQLSCVRDG